MEIALVVVALVALLAVAAWFRAIRQRDEVARQRDEANIELSTLRGNYEVRIAEITQARQDLDTYFKGMAAEVLHANSEAFLQQAKEQLASQSKLSEADLEKREKAIGALVEPIKENLAKFESRVNEIEKTREGAYRGLEKELGLLRETAGNLANALRSPQIRGLWGEQQLRNILELSGMREHIDFFEQRTITGDDGALRPDAVVRVPGGVQVVIDAKTPLDSYLDAHAADDMQRKADLLKKQPARS